MPGRGDGQFFQRMIDVFQGDDSRGILSCISWNSIDFCIQMNILKGVFETLQDNLVEI